MINISIIEVKNLSKVYKQSASKGKQKGLLNRFLSDKTDVHAVNGISFSIDQGETVGYIGPNGAGKSTTIKMLAGILVPTSGELEVDGMLPWKDRKQYSEKIGVVFGQRSQLWWDLPISDTYNLYRHMYKIPGTEYNSRIDQLKKLLDLNDFWDRPVRQLSLGQRMRGELGAALLHKPKLLFLDEPTIGMDVIVKEAIRNFIKDINAEYGTTILLTTHDLDEVERTCSRVIVINKGTKIYDGTMEELKSRCNAESILSVEFEANIEKESFEGLKVVNKCGNKASFAFLRRERGAGQVLVRLSDLSIRDIVIQEPPIEDVIREFYT